MVSVVIFGWFLCGVSPGLYWLDAGEFVAASAELGVVHPPGTPGYVLLTHLAQLLPVGTLGFRAGLASAALMSAAIWFALGVVERRGARAWIVVGAGLWMALAGTIMRNACVAEIYGLECCMAMGLVAALDGAQQRPEDARPWLSAVALGTWGGWCFGDLRVFALAAVVWVWIRRPRSRRSTLVWTPLVVVAGSLPIWTLPLASARGPSRDWGNPETMATVWDHLTARTIVDAFEPQIMPAEPLLWWNALGELGLRLAEDMGPVGVVAAVVAFMGWAIHRSDGSLVELLLLLIGVEVIYGAGVNPMGLGDRQTGMVLVMALVIGTAVAATRLASARPRASLAMLPLAWCVSVLPQALVAGEALRTTRSWMPQMWATEALAQTGPRGLLSAQSDDLISGILHAQAVEGARPDVLMFIPHHLHKGPADEVPEAHRGFWRAVESARDDEASQVRAGWESWPGPRRAESPGYLANAGLPGPGTVEVPTAGVERTRVTAAVQIERWMRWAESSEDRRRIARGLNSGAAGRVHGAGTTAAVLAEVESIYRDILDRLDPEYVPAMVSLAVVLEGLGRPESAVALLQSASALDPTRPSVRRNLALITSRLVGPTAEAIAEARLAARLRPWEPRGWILLERLCTEANEPTCREDAARRLAALEGER